MSHSGGLHFGNISTVDVKSLHCYNKKFLKKPKMSDALSWLHYHDKA